jgi:hypothetical protein
MARTHAGDLEQYFPKVHPSEAWHEQNTFNAEQ